MSMPTVLTTGAGSGNSLREMARSPPPRLQQAPWTSLTRFANVVPAARHLSQPGRNMVVRLAESLELPLRERNELLLAAGYAPVYPESSLDDAALAPVRTAIDHILRGHLPYPAVVVDDAIETRVARSYERFVEKGDSRSRRAPMPCAWTAWSSSAGRRCPSKPATWWAGGLEVLVLDDGRTDHGHGSGPREIGCISAARLQISRSAADRLQMCRSVGCPGRQWADGHSQIAELAPWPLLFGIRLPVDAIRASQAARVRLVGSFGPQQRAAEFPSLMDSEVVIPGPLVRVPRRCPQRRLVRQHERGRQLPQNPGETVLKIRLGVEHGSVPAQPCHDVAQ